MLTLSRDDFARSELEHPFQLAERIWWVGHYQPGDPFQCHVYLIENGDQSVLIDPGSNLTFRHTLRKIQQIIPFSRIRYFVCHHQDPDITAALPVIDDLVTRDDAMVVTHWRAIALLKHYDLRMPFLCVEKNGWRLDLGGRELEFIFTPYLHFPGNFCTYDRASAILFTSDIFGGFTEDWHLLAQDEGYFEQIRPFHEHYMPSREILFHGLSRLEQRPIRMIAPQHGSIIPEHLVGYMFRKLKETDCGLFLMSQTSTEVERLSALNKTLRGFLESIYLSRDFQEIAQFLQEHARPILPVARLEFYARTPEGSVLLLAPETLYRGAQVTPPAIITNILDTDWGQWREHGLVLPPYPAALMTSDPERPYPADSALVIPLFQGDGQSAHAVAVFGLSAPLVIDGEMAHTLSQLSRPLSVAVEREIIYRVLELERQKFYELSIRDALTGLYTRVMMNEAVQRLLDIHDRDDHATLAVLVLDVDHFKRVNDTHGHNAGDEVLRHVAEVLKQETRRGDIAVRLGGEEFAIFLVGAGTAHARDIAERIRVQVAELAFPPPLGELRVTLSGGVAFHQQGEKLGHLLNRADAALYRAKSVSRNCIVLAE